MKFEMKRPSGKHILEVEGVSKAYDDECRGAQLHRQRAARRKDRPDGTQRRRQDYAAQCAAREFAHNAEAELRKTSGYDGAFLDSGKVIWGHEASVGYFAQDHQALIQDGTTAFEWLQQWDPQASNEEIRGLLGQMLFRAKTRRSRKPKCSPAARPRGCIFCKLMLQKPNVLVLDEPTNHLDLESINALNIALQRYQGTVLLVTHDHDLIDEVATRIWHFESDHKITDFKGGYEEYQTVQAQTVQA